MHKPDAQSESLETLFASESRSNRAGSIELYRRLIKGHQPLAAQVDDFPFTALDCELMLDAISAAGFIDVIASNESEAAKDMSRLLWRFFVSSLVAHALEAILPDSSPIVIVGQSQHIFRRNDPSEPDTADRLTTTWVCWVMTDRDFMNGKLVVDPLGWSIGETVERDLPSIMIVGLSQHKDHLGSTWGADAYRTGFLTRDYARNDVLTNVARQFVERRVKLWRGWKDVC